jgi:acyl transferase domain-containing protein
MHVACNAFWRGHIDAAIAGGTDVTINPDITAGLYRGHFLSRTGDCTSCAYQIIQETPTNRNQVKPSMMMQMDTAVERALQPAATCNLIAMAKLWQSWGIQSVAVFGQSLGEYTALNISGVLADADTIMLAGKRVQLLTEKYTHETHAMLAIAASMHEVLKNDLSRCQYEIACRNGPREVVLSGTNDNVDKLHQALSATGFRLTRLREGDVFGVKYLVTNREIIAHRTNDGVGSRS